MHLILVDGSSYIYRAFHALPALTRPADGAPVGAVFGFCTMLWKLMAEQANQPATHMAVIFDKKAPTFRHKLYADYKATRTGAPDELKVQFDMVRQATAAFGLPALEQEGFEADDLIATYTRLAVAEGADVTIVGSDKDLMQLVGERVTMLDTMKDRRIGPFEVEEKWGVPPSKMIDLQALMGDSVDNVPGVPGIGPKTAAELLGRYGDLDGVFQNVDSVSKPKQRASLLEHQGDAYLSKRLVTLDHDVPLDVALDALVSIDRDYYRLIGFCKAMGFVTITAKIAVTAGIDMDTVPALVAA